MSGVKISPARMFTATMYILVAAVVILIGGYVASAICAIIAAFILYDAVEAVRKANIRPFRITVYLSAVLSLVAYIFIGLSGVFCVFALAVIITLCAAVFSHKRTFNDVVFTLFLLMYPVVPILMFLFVTLCKDTEIQRIFLLLLFLMPSACDVFALLAGMAFGKRKLCPHISPKKTVAGSIGAFVGSMLAGLVAGIVIINCFTDVIPLYHYVLLGLISGFFSQVGDLSASLLKRFCGIKDFGSYLPGHGGMLDRFDSSIVVAVWLFFYMEIILN